MEFTKYGFDVYSAEIDDKGIDFVLRNGKNNYFDIQIKSIRNKSYVYMQKRFFEPSQNLLLALVIFVNNKDPLFLLIPSLDWKTKKYPFLVDRDFIGKKSQPEFGINISRESLEVLKKEYSFEKQIPQLSKN